MAKQSGDYPLKSITATTKSLQVDWKDIPIFAVITGENGSGKTQLLNEIWRTESQRLGDKFVLHIKADGSPNNTIHNLTNTKDWIRDFKQTYSNRGLEIDWADNNIKTAFVHNLVQNNNQLAIFKDVENQLLKEIESISTATEVERWVAKKASQIEKSPVKITSRIAELIRKDLVVPKGSNDARQLTEEDCLYYKLNQELRDILIQGRSLFKHQIRKPTNIHREGDYELVFENGNGRDDIAFDALSGGEKIIFELICYKYFLTNEKEETIKPKLILLDEFDAKLNPVLAEAFIKVIEEKFNDKGIQVIITSHSPATVARITEEHLFWMENGDIRRKEKMEVVHQLSSGYLAEASSSGDPFLSYLSDPRKPYFLFAEGYTDLLHLKAACRNLGEGYLKIIEKCNFFHMNGIKHEKAIDVFVKNFAGVARKVIVLVDLDQAGNKVSKNFSENRQNNICCETLIPPDGPQKDFGYCPIELLYPDDQTQNLVKVVSKDASEIFEADKKCIYWANCNSDKTVLMIAADGKEKVEFAEKMYEFSHSPDVFSNFKPTLDRILEAIESFERI